MNKTDLTTAFEQTSFLYGGNAQFIEQLAQDIGRQILVEHFAQLKRRHRLAGGEQRRFKHFLD